MKKKVKTGVVHGRLQPLHKDHMKYFLAGFEQAEFVYVGITNPDPNLTNEDKADANRAKLMSNPCNYYERMEMLNRSLVEAGISHDRFRVVPFPINYPELLKHYVPEDAIFYMTIYDQWGDRKQELMESVGLKVEVLWKRPEDQKGINATIIREAIARGEAWEYLVPEGTASVIRDFGIDRRIREIFEAESTEGRGRSA
jgi:nicotinamide mononucleotide adenylyltransferase